MTGSTPLSLSRPSNTRVNLVSVSWIRYRLPKRNPSNRSVNCTESGFENAILFLQIDDDLLLVTIDPAGDHGDEDVQDHGVPRVESRDVMVPFSIRPT